MEKFNVKKELKLPEGYDVVNEYQDKIEQNVVDNLFDYFGRVYYRTNENKKGEKIRNKSISKYDNQILRFISKESLILFLIFIPLLLIGVAGLLCLGFFVGTDINSINAKLTELTASGSISRAGWDTIILTSLVLSILFIGSSALVLIWVFVWRYRRSLQKERINDKISQWNKNFDKFTSNLKFNGLMNAIQASLPEFVVDKYTPTYDRRIYNLHNRIYSYADIPQDAKRLDYSNLLSGFYKGNAFSLSFSSWEWFREAKVIEQNIDKSNSHININVKRNLKDLKILFVY